MHGFACAAKPPHAYRASSYAGPSAQVTFENSDATAAAALAKSMRDTGGANIFVPGFGNAAIGSVKEFTVPVDAKLARCGRLASLYSVRTVHI
jgi:hypothetical protein